MGSSLGSALEFLVSLNDGSVYPKFQQSTHAILPPIRLRGECDGLAGNVTAQKDKGTLGLPSTRRVNEKSFAIRGAKATSTAQF
jgi:hypothetical protein